MNFKTYVLIISTRFPITHWRAGEETFFSELIEAGFKKHTIRHNYALWDKRIKSI